MYNKTPYPIYPQPMAPTGSFMPTGTFAQTGTFTPMGTNGPMVIPNASMTGYPPPVPSGVPITPAGATVIPGLPAVEESYVENILRMNLGKVATLYMTYENNSEWNAKIFKGVLEAAGRDHIIISDPVSGKRYLLLTINLDYVTFDEPLVYTLPFGGGLTR